MFVNKLVIFRFKQKKISQLYRPENYMSKRERERGRKPFKNRIASRFCYLIIFIVILRIFYQETCLIIIRYIATYKLFRLKKIIKIMEKMIFAEYWCTSGEIAYATVWLRNTNVYSSHSYVQAWKNQTVDLQHANGGNDPTKEMGESETYSNRYFYLFAIGRRPLLEYVSLAYIYIVSTVIVRKLCNIRRTCAASRVLDGCYTIVSIMPESIYLRSQRKFWSWILIIKLSETFAFILDA